jgi:hypothetical protein
MSVRRLGAVLLVGAILTLPAADPALAAAKPDRSLAEGWCVVLGWEPLGFLVSPDLADLAVHSDVATRWAAVFFPPFGINSEDPVTVVTAINNTVLGPGSYLDPALTHEETDTAVSVTASLRAGIVHVGPHTVWDLTAGGGFLANEVFSSSLLRADTSLRVRCGRYLAVGPHLGWVHLSAAAEDEDWPVEIGGGDAGLVGLRLGFTTRRALLDMNLDAWFDDGLRVTPHRGFTTEPARLHLSGVLGSLTAMLVF